MTRPAPRPIISEGTIADFAALAHHHYHPHPPPTRVRVLTARLSPHAPPIGVLLVSLPVLNASWRDLAFPGRYRSADRRADARRLNAEVRTISRVVVDPRHRGLGVGVELVRHYLRAPLTDVTEAVASMGPFCRFFEAAGMRAFPVAPAPRDLRLADAVASLHIEAWMLADPELIPARKIASPFLARELCRWAQGSRATRACAGLGTVELLRRAARIFHPPTAYVAVRADREAA